MLCYVTQADTLTMVIDTARVVYDEQGLCNVRVSVRLSVCPVVRSPPLLVCCCAPSRLYILCWRQHSRRKLSPTLATPTTLVLTTLVPNVNSAGVKLGYSWKSLGGNFTQPWQPCHSWSGKMAGRRRHCRQ